MLVSNPNDEQVTPQQLQLRIKLNQEYQSEIALIEQKAQFYLKNQEEISVHPNSVEIIGATRENKQKLLNEISRVSESAPVKSSTYVVVSPALYRPPMLAAFDYQQKDFQQKTDVLFIDDLRELHASLLILAKKRFVFHQFLFSLTPLLFTTDHHVLHILEELAEKSIPVFNTTLYDGLRYLKDERFYLSTQELSQLRTAVEAIIWNEVEFYVSLLRNSIETMVESIQYPQAITESFTQKILSALHSSTNVQEFFIKIFPYIQKEMETSYISALETTNQMIRCVATLSLFCPALPVYSRLQLPMSSVMPWSIFSNIILTYLNTRIELYVCFPMSTGPTRLSKKLDLISLIFFLFMVFLIS
jgi:hypothetical protein